ncbi:hypothetical protein JCM17846_27290 [Iodidimonas nitroreducens]|uniref:DUF3168 domain-containing protein n=1 Tax=Iodidimonas nitroreducens TaxID=1236968 RepID=A0A5A7NAV2_9PROT|nr:DUF3168 domain-containing protein [Iodidimonas nitroreducens]GAK34417.1 hypothetical protein AQ1_02316 [alpha proteobacterium Q-1]GER05047.1 hypothetical protein JCM17846_27290 [Iodidimonas nitroreducens]
MSEAGFAAINQAIKAHLLADGALMGGLKGVFDEPDHRARLPYAIIGPHSISDWSAQNLDGTNWRITIRVFSRHPANREVLLLADQIRARLLDGGLAIEGWHLAHLQFEGLQSLRDGDGVSQAQLRFKALIHRL